MIAPMTKVQIAIPDTKRDEFLRWLQEEELLHVVENGGDETHDITPTSTSYELAQVQYAIEFIDRIKKELGHEKKRFWQGLIPKPLLASIEELERSYRNLDLEELLADIKKTSDVLATVSAQRHDIKENVASHTPWKRLKITGSQLRNKSNVRHGLLILGIQEEGHFKELMEQLPLAAWQVAHRISDKSGGKLYIEAVVDPSNSRQFDEVIEKTQAQEVILDLGSDRSVSEQIEFWNEESKRLNGEYEELVKKAKSFFKYEKELKHAYDALLNREAREKLEMYITKLSFVSVITGWMPAARLDYVLKTAEKKFPGVSIEQLKVAEDENPPVLLQNARSLQPFEAVTNVYGKPKYSEIDPSPLLSFFFLIAFGFALTDAGYGLLIMLGTSLALKYVPLKRETRKMVRLMFYAGIVTVILGALSGGWFGIVLENLPPSSVKDALLTIKVIDPVSEPIRLLILALIIGIVQLLFATGIKAYSNIKQKNYAAALLDDFAWMSLIVAILTWVAARQGILSSTITQIALWWVYASAAVMILFNGRAYKNIILRLGSGVLSLYGLMSFLSDVLSYSRLLALGLATGIIGLVVNLIGGLISDAVPGIGILLAAVILIFGHIANLAINTLGAFIHSSRLQFVEFFPKFMEGGGLAFKPFGRVVKYVENPREYKD